MRTATKRGDYILTATNPAFSRGEYLRAEPVVWRRSGEGDGMMNRRRIGVAAIMLALGFVVVPTTRAAAEPATTVSYPTHRLRHATDRLCI